MTASEIIALSSAILSFASVTTMVITLWIQRDHNVKSLSPWILTYKKSTKTKDEVFEVIIRNCGLGPAIIYNIFVVFKGNKLCLDIFKKDNFNYFQEQIIASNIEIEKDSFNSNVIENSEGSYLKVNDDLTFFSVNSDKVKKEHYFKFSELLNELHFEVVYGSLYDNKPYVHKPDKNECNLTDFSQIVKNYLSKLRVD